MQNQTHLGAIKSTVTLTQLPGLPKILEALLQLLQEQTGRGRGHEVMLWMRCIDVMLGGGGAKLGHDAQGVLQRKDTWGGMGRRCSANTVPPAQHGPRLQHPPGSHQGVWPEPFGRRSPAWRRQSAQSPGRHRSLPPAVGQRCEQGNGGHRGDTGGTPTCSSAQKMCASSCWKRLTRVSPVREPGGSLRCSTPKSARRSGSSRHDRGRWANMRLPTGGQMDGRQPCRASPHPSSVLSSPVGRAVHGFK